MRSRGQYFLSLPRATTTSRSGNDVETISVVSICGLLDKSTRRTIRKLNAASRAPCPDVRGRNFDHVDGLLSGPDMHCGEIMSPL